MSFPNFVASKYRTGKNANEFFVYGGVFEPDSNFVRIQFDPDSYFLLRKVHAVNYVNVAGASVSINYFGRMLDGASGRPFQSIRVHNQILGGNVHSPNVLPAPYLFEPNSVFLLDMDRTPTRVHLALEGERVYDPDPAWIKRMRSRYWFQYGVEAVANDATQIVSLPLRDPNYDFAIFRCMSANFTNGYLSNANPGFLRIRDKGPNGQQWSNEEVPNVNYSGVFGNGAGPRSFTPPIIVPGTSELEITFRSVPTGVVEDLVFDGVKFPRGTNLEDWL